METQKQSVNCEKRTVSDLATDKLFLKLNAHNQNMYNQQTFKSHSVQIYKVTHCISFFMMI